MTQQLKRVVAKSITLSLLLWRDAAPSTTFPSPKEIVALELTRIMTSEPLMRAIPDLRATYESVGASHLLRLNPWDIDPVELLDKFVAAVQKSNNEALATALIEEQGHQDVCLDLIRYRQKVPTNSQTTIKTLAARVCTALKLPSEEDHNKISEAYSDVYTKLVKV